MFLEKKGGQMNEDNRAVFIKDKTGGISGCAFEHHVEWMFTRFALK